MSSEQRRHNLAGISWMLGAVAALSLMDAAMKLLAPHYPPQQVAAIGDHPRQDLVDIAFQVSGYGHGVPPLAHETDNSLQTTVTLSGAKRGPARSAAKWHSTSGR